MICGDGLTHGTEGCDDGNLNDGDGCNSICQVELYYLCINNPVGTVNSTCFFDTNRFRLKLKATISSCNQL